MKILYVLGAFGSGGVESVVANILVNIDHSKFKIDFVLFNGLDHSRKNLIEKYGSDIFYIERSGKGIIRNIFQIYKILKTNKYDIIHAHTNETSILSAIAGKIAGTPSIICHSHNTNFRKNERLVPFIRFLFKVLPNKLLACSEEAGKKLFGKTSDFKIFKNGINIDKFIYNEDVRLKVRKNLGLEDKFVIGNVGRLNPQKNHKFLLDTFKLISNKKKNVMLLIVGDGELEAELKSQIIDLGIENNVILLGARDDINELLQAIDLFVFPSIFEGLGISLIEAQCSGLKCVASDAIPREVEVTNLVEFLPLEKGPEYWCKRILDYTSKYDRENTRNYIVKAGYDIKSSTEELENIYIGLLNGNR